MSEELTKFGQWMRIVSAFKYCITCQFSNDDKEKLNMNEVKAINRLMNEINAYVRKFCIEKR